MASPLSVKGIYSIAASSPTLTAIVLFVVYEIVKILYRLTFHPLAKFPGPKLAAISSWYELYFELYIDGRFYQQIEKLHQQYGPIVRINPSELHVNDPEYYDKLYNFSPNFDKKKFQIENLQHTPSFELHKLRRQAMGPFFSRQSVLKVEYLILSSIEKLCSHLKAAKVSREPMNMAILYRSLTSDIISEYAFSHSYGFLDNLENSTKFFNTFKKSWKLMWFIKNVPILSQALRSMNKLPKWMLPQDETMAVWRLVDARIRAHVKAVLSPDNKPSSSLHPTIFAAIQRGKLLAQDKTEDSIYLNSGLILSAGFETTGFALGVAHYHVLANPSVCRKLKAELATPFNQLGDDKIPAWTTLEKLPYLSAVINESLRLSTGVMTRLPRRNTKEDMRFQGWTIPRGVLVGMSQPLIHFNAEIFPDPWRFDPERWMRGEESKALEKYLVSFSRGARECIAKQLAKAELYLTLATVFHRFDMELFETTRADVDPKRDHFVPTLEGDSKGVRVLVQ